MTPQEYKTLNAILSENNGYAAKVHDIVAWLERCDIVSSVTVSELQALLDGPDLQGGVWNAIRKLIDKHTPKPELPPNPHPVGTYLWAREEHARGRSVATAWKNNERLTIRKTRAWSDARFTHTDFIATDWEVVP